MPALLHYNPYRWSVCCFCLLFCHVHGNLSCICPWLL
jgi:hypothetical protein